MVEFWASFVLYAYGVLLVALLVIFWQALKPKDAAAEFPLDVTIVIPFHNERDALPGLIRNSVNLGHKVLLVNDHSNDLDENELRRMVPGGNMLLLHLPQGLYGKKAALHFGIEHSVTEWVLTSDADTFINRDWLLAAGALTTKDAKAWVLPVKPAKQPSWGSKWFDLEFVGLQVVGLASAKAGMPLLANGAAFLFQREAYMMSYNQRRDLEIPHGDDIFTLHAIASTFGNMALGASMGAGVAALASFPEKVDALWLQRCRWIAKVPAVRSMPFAAVSALTLLAHVAHGCMLILWVLDIADLGTAFWLKIVLEAALLTTGVLYFRRLDCLWLILPGLFVYPFYFMSLILGSILIKPRWKRSK